MALSLAIPSIAYAEDAPPPKQDCCAKMKAEGKKCCCEDKGKDEHAEHDTEGMSHDKS